MSYNLCLFICDGKAGINDGKEQAIELSELLHACGRRYHVNLIPFNPIEESEYRRPYKKAVSTPSLSAAFMFNL